MMMDETAYSDLAADIDDSDCGHTIIRSFTAKEISVYEGGELTDLHDEQHSIMHETNPTTEPYIGMEFESEDAAMVYYDAYAKQVGFIVCVSNCHRSSHDGSVISRRFLCNKECFRVNNKKIRKLEVRKPREIRREGCKAMITVRKEKSGKWIVTKLEKEHNHPLGIISGKVRRGLIQARPKDEKDKKIRELSAELHLTKRQLGKCQSQLDIILKPHKPPHCKYSGRN